jgi:hypothetical protein
LGSFVKNYRRCTNNWATYLNSKSYVLIIFFNELGDILGDFFTNASGHPANTERKKSVAEMSTPVD